MWTAAAGLFAAWRAAAARPLRLLGVTASQLVGGRGGQLPLFADETRARQGRLDRAMDEITGRFGPGAVGRAAARRRDHNEG